MARATTNRTDISYIAELTPGTTPATPTFQIVPTTDGAPSFGISTEVSEEIRSDRQISDLVVVDAETAGEINFELSYVPWKPILQEILRDDAGVTDSMTNGIADPTNYTFCKRVFAGATPYYFYYTGTVLSGLSLSFATGTRLTGTLSVMGRSENATATGITGQDFNDPLDYAIMNSVNHVTAIDITGLPANTCFQTLDLSINNNSTGSKCIGTLGNDDVQDFSLEVTGSIETYFDDLTLYEKFKNSESFSIDITLDDGPGNQMIIKMPKCKFEELDVPIDGKDQFLVMPGSFRALRDDALGYTIGIDFTDTP